MNGATGPERREVSIPAGGAVSLPGDLLLPSGPVSGVVLFAHGSGSSRLSPRNREVAMAILEAGPGALLFDLLTDEEASDRANVFDIGLLAERLLAATAWVREQPSLGEAPLGYFGASTGAAAALVAAAEEGPGVHAVVSRGGRPDLAGEALPRVAAPTLLIVGGRDEVVLELNRQAKRAMRCPTALEVIPGATHLFEEPGALDRVADLAVRWFTQHLSGGGPNRGEARDR